MSSAGHQRLPKSQGNKRTLTWSDKVNHSNWQLHTSTAASLFWFRYPRGYVGELKRTTYEKESATSAPGRWLRRGNLFNVWIRWFTSGWICNQATGRSRNRSVEEVPQSWLREITVDKIRHSTTEAKESNWVSENQMKGRAFRGGRGGKRRGRSGIDTLAPTSIRKWIECAEWAKTVSHDWVHIPLCNYSLVVFG